jgi:hypothetical protein
VNRNKILLYFLNCISLEEEWKPWKFSVLPFGYWNKKSNQRAYINYVSETLGLKDMGICFNLCILLVIDKQNIKMVGTKWISQLGSSMVDMICSTDMTTTSLSFWKAYIQVPSFALY